MKGGQYPNSFSVIDYVFEVGEPDLLDSDLLPTLPSKAVKG